MDIKEDVPTIKCVMIGDKECGKPCASMRYTTDHFVDYSEHVAMDNWSSRTVVNDEPVLLSIWDTIGEGESERIKKIVFRLREKNLEINQTNLRTKRR